MMDRDPKTNNRSKDRLEYENLKTQCVYRFLELRVNAGEVRFDITSETCVIDGEHTTKVKVGSILVDVRTLLKADLRSFRRRETPEETETTTRKKIEQKELQKIALGGRSPDFGDCAFMREYFSLSPVIKGVRVD